MNTITIYHGSENIVQNPNLLAGKRHNDYGQGFYCTEDIDLAKEWACKNETDGFVNEQDPMRLSQNRLLSMSSACLLFAEKFQSSNKI